ncbi:MAG: PAS domain-containing protein [Candidatus Riflebacteria bacterium]
MITKCAWCQKIIKNSDQTQEKSFPISHGICEECSAIMVQQLDSPVQAFLDSFSQAIMMVDNLNNVIVANKAAKKLSKIDFDMFEQPRCGNLIGCIHSDAPEGCGATVHCQGCVIRRSILETDKTGRPCREIACADKFFYQGNRVANMVVTTEKVGDRILLKIEPIDGKPEKK